MSTQNIPFSVEKKKFTLNYPKYAAMRFFSKGLQNEFETAVVNEPSVFKPLKFYCSKCFIFTAVSVETVNSKCFIFSAESVEMNNSKCFIYIVDSKCFIFSAESVEMNNSKCFIYIVDSKCFIFSAVSVETVKSKCFLFTASQ